MTFIGIDGAELTSPVVLDLRIYKHREWMEVHGIHDAAKALRDIRDNQKKWTEDLHGRLSVITRDGAAKDEKEQARIAEMRRSLETQAKEKRPPTERSS